MNLTSTKLEDLGVVEGENETVALTPSSNEICDTDLTSSG